MYTVPCLPSFASLRPELAADEPKSYKIKAYLEIKHQSLHEKRVGWRWIEVSQIETSAKKLQGAHDVMHFRAAKIKPLTFWSEILFGPIVC